MPSASSYKLEIPTEMEDIEEWLEQLIFLIESANETGQFGSQKPSQISTIDLPTQMIKWKALSDGFGRKDPFMPLTVEDVGTSGIYEDSGEAMAIQKKTDANNGEPLIRLTAVFIAGAAGGRGNIATIEENGVSRSISIGDTVAGMEVMGIQRGKVVLGNKDKKLTMKLGTLFGVESTPYE